MKKRNDSDYPYLENLIELIYTKRQNLLPFLDIFRNDINSLKFLPLGADKTAAIFLNDNKFDIIFSVDFIKEYELSDDDILWTLCHEISHYVLGHLTSEYEKIYPQSFRNFGYDCQVNSMLYNINKRNRIPSLELINLETYDNFLNGGEDDLYFLLVPPHLPEKKVAKDFEKAEKFWDKEKLRLIHEFWFRNYGEEGLGLAEIFDYLEKIMPPEKNDADTEKEENEICFDEPGEIDEEDLPAGVIGFFDNLTNKEEEGARLISQEELETAFGAMLSAFDVSELEAERRKLNVLRAAMSEAIFENSRGAVAGVYYDKSQTVLPNVTRRESLLLGADIPPAFYSNLVEREEPNELAVYIDFSGSTSDYHAEISKLISGSEEFRKAQFFAFTTEVREIAFEDFLRGEFISGGTDIEPVFRHIADYGFKKALIITDGEFSSPGFLPMAELYVLLLGEFSVADNFGVVPKRMWKIE